MDAALLRRDARSTRVKRIIGENVNAVSGVAR